MPKSKQSKKQATNHSPKTKKDTIDLDKEIIIGLRVKEEPAEIKKGKKTTSKKKKTKNISPKKYKEQQEKAKIKRMHRFRVVKYVLLCGIGIASLIYVALSPVFNIATIEITGNAKITTEQILSLSQLQTGTNLFRFRKSDIQTRVKQNAYIDTVSISRRYPDTVQIHVTERTPAYALELNGNYMYINNQGYMLEFVAEPTDFMLLTGFSTNMSNIQVGNRLEVEDLQKLETILKITEAIQSNDLGQVVNKIDMSNKKNYRLILESEKKDAYIGEGKDLSTRMLYIKGILEQESGKEGDIFVDMDINNGDLPMFREKV